MFGGGKSKKNNAPLEGEIIQNKTEALGALLDTDSIKWGVPSPKRLTENGSSKNNLEGTSLGKTEIQGFRVSACSSVEKAFS